MLEPESPPPFSEHLPPQQTAPTQSQHPPMMPGVMPPPPTVWPTVLGVIAIVLGAFGTLQGGMGLLAPLLFGHFRGAATNMQGFDPFAGVDQYKSHLVVSSIATMLAGVLLLLGAILLTMRRRPSRSVILAWSAFKIIVVTFGAWVGWLVNQAQFASMQQSGTTPAGMGGMMDVMSGLGVALTVAWGFALPIFMIVWFTRRGIRSEVAAWK